MHISEVRKNMIINEVKAKPISCQVEPLIGNPNVWYIKFKEKRVYLKFKSITTGIATPKTVKLFISLFLSPLLKRKHEKLILQIDEINANVSILLLLLFSL